MVIKTYKPSSQTKISSIETEGEAAIVKNGEIEEFHFISPDTDPDDMRELGALGEMIFEQSKKTFRAESMVIVAQNKDFNLLMFPNKKGFVIWKTNLSIEQALQDLRTNTER
jgi:hypothetical protein